MARRPEIVGGEPSRATQRTHCLGHWCFLCGVLSSFGSSTAGTASQYTNALVFIWKFRGADARGWNDNGGGMKRCPRRAGLSWLKPNQIALTNSLVLAICFSMIET